MFEKKTRAELFNVYTSLTTDSALGKALEDIEQALAALYRCDLEEVSKLAARASDDADDNGDEAFGYKLWDIHKALDVLIEAVDGFDF